MRFPSRLGLTEGPELINRRLAGTLAALAVLLAGCSAQSLTATTAAVNSAAAADGVSAIHASPAPADTAVGIVQKACTSTLSTVSYLADTIPVYMPGDLPMCRWTNRTGLTVIMAVEADTHHAPVDASIPGWTATTVNGHPAVHSDRNPQPGCIVEIDTGTGTVQVNTYRPDPRCATAMQIAAAITPPK
jgi:hypothetical protein